MKIIIALIIIALFLVVFVYLALLLKKKRRRRKTSSPAAQKRSSSSTLVPGVPEVPGTTTDWPPPESKSDDSLNVTSGSGNDYKLTNFLKVGAFALWYEEGAVDKSVVQSYGDKLNYVRADTLENWHFFDPPNMRHGHCVNIYFDKRPPGVGTESIDAFRCPFMVLNPEYGFDEKLILHEGFHIFQWCGTNCGGERGFAYSENMRWYTETLANTYVALNSSDPLRFHEMAGIVANPHLNMWQSFGNLKGKDDPSSSESWLYGVRQYSCAIPYYLITQKNIPRKTFSEGHYNNTKLSPQEYMFQNIDNFAGLYADFAASTVHRKWLSEEESKLITSEISAWAKTEGEHHVHSYTCEFELQKGLQSCPLDPIASNGEKFLQSPHKLEGEYFYPSDYTATRPWGFNVYKMIVDKPSQLALILTSEGIFELRIVKVDGSVQAVKTAEYFNVSKGTYYIVIVCTSPIFEGYESISYGLKLSKKDISADKRNMIRITNTKAFQYFRM